MQSPQCSAKPTGYLLPRRGQQTSQETHINLQHKHGLHTSHDTTPARRIISRTQIYTKTQHAYVRTYSKQQGIIRCLRTYVQQAAKNHKRENSFRHNAKIHDTCPKPSTNSSWKKGAFFYMGRWVRYYCYTYKRYHISLGPSSEGLSFQPKLHLALRDILLSRVRDTIYAKESQPPGTYSSCVHQGKLALAAEESVPTPDDQKVYMLDYTPPPPPNILDQCWDHRLPPSYRQPVGCTAVVVTKAGKSVSFVCSQSSSLPKFLKHHSLSHRKPRPAPALAH